MAARNPRKEGAWLGARQAQPAKAARTLRFDAAMERQLKLEAELERVKHDKALAAALRHLSDSSSAPSPKTHKQNLFYAAWNEAQTALAAWDKAK